MKITFIFLVKIAETNLSFSIWLKDIKFFKINLFFFFFVCFTVYHIHVQIVTYLLEPYNPSVIMQKGESQNGCFKKTKHVKFSEKRTFLEMFVFSENLTCFVFLKQPFWDSPFCLIMDGLGALFFEMLILDHL